MVKRWKFGALAGILVLAGLGAREVTHLYCENRNMHQTLDLISKECLEKPHCFVVSKGY